jgi:hypothetical protein
MVTRRRKAVVRRPGRKSSRRLSLRRIHQTKTMGDDTIGVALRPCGAGISRDVVVELEEVRLRFRSKDDRTRHGGVFSDAWRGTRGVRP